MCEVQCDTHTALLNHIKCEHGQEENMDRHRPIKHWLHRHPLHCENPFHCEECDTTHVSKKVKCAICEAQFDTITALLNHMQCEHGQEGLMVQGI